MAKGYGLSGKIQGKLGSKVYRIEAGEQIISEYNPTKTDPQTEKQVKQRTKMTEATKVSRYFPWETIVGYSPNRSRARQDFNSFLAKLAVASIVDDTVRASIDLTKIELSKGVPVMLDNWQLGSVSPQNTQIVNGSVRIPADMPCVGFLFVVIYSPEPLSQPYRAYYAISSKPNAQNVCSASVTLSSVGALHAGLCYAYAIPLVVNTLKKRVVYSKVIEATSAGVLSTDAWVTLARADIFAATYYIGSITFV